MSLRPISIRFYLGLGCACLEMVCKGNDFPPYLDLGFALRIDCAKCARYRKITFKSKYHPRMFPNYMLCIRTLSPSFFNSNRKRNVIRQMPRIQVYVDIRYSRINTKKLYFCKAICPAKNNF